MISVRYTRTSSAWVLAVSGVFSIFSYPDLKVVNYDAVDVIHVSD
jgi:hypothetical protein